MAYLYSFTLFNLLFSVADFITPTDYYNFSNVSGDRQWLADILQENTDNPPDEVQYQHILKLHSYQKNLRQSKKVSPINRV